MSNKSIYEAIYKFSNEIRKYDGEIESMVLSENIFQRLAYEILSWNININAPLIKTNEFTINTSSGFVLIKSSKKREIARLKATIESAQAKLAKLEAHNEKE
jgi:hypothetical protein